MAKRKKISEGTFVVLKINANNYVFGRLMKMQTLLIYDYLQNVPDLSISITELKDMSPAFYVPIYDYVLKGEILGVIGYQDLTEDDVKKQPPRYWQNIVNSEDCVLVYPNGDEIKTTPDKCVGLEKLGAWGDDNIIERLKIIYQINK